MLLTGENDHWKIPDTDHIVVDQILQFSLLIHCHMNLSVGAGSQKQETKY